MFAYGMMSALCPMPRSQASGFDYYAPNNSILFYGDCRPNSLGAVVALSYRYWVGGGCPPDGCPNTCNPPCVDPWYCVDGQCICPADCGGCDPGQTCNTTTCTCEQGQSG